MIASLSDPNASATHEAGRRPHLNLVHTAVKPAVAHGCNLTTLDMLALSRWMRQSELHGYPRTVIEVGDSSGAPEDGGYALVYEPGQCWARWGIARDGAELVVWHCATGADQGRFPKMQAALDSLPVIWRRISRKVERKLSFDGRSNIVRLARSTRS